MAYIIKQGFSLQEVRNISYVVSLDTSDYFALVKNNVGNTVITLRTDGSNHGTLELKNQYGTTRHYFNSENGSYMTAGCTFGNNSTPDSSSCLEGKSTTKGFLPPRLTTTQKNAISSPATGLIVYDTTLNKLCVYTGSAWETITSA